MEPDAEPAQLPRPFSPPAYPISPPVPLLKLPDDGLDVFGNGGVLLNDGGLIHCHAHGALLKLGKQLGVLERGASSDSGHGSRR